MGFIAILCLLISSNLDKVKSMYKTPCFHPTFNDKLILLVHYNYKLILFKLKGWTSRYLLHYMVMYVLLTWFHMWHWISQYGKYCAFLC
jgi:hypothetical protein